MPPVPGDTGQLSETQGTSDPAPVLSAVTPSKSRPQNPCASCHFCREGTSHALPASPATPSEPPPTAPPLARVSCPALFLYLSPPATRCLFVHCLVTHPTHCTEMSPARQQGRGPVRSPLRSQCPAKALGRGEHSGSICRTWDQTPRTHRAGQSSLARTSAAPSSSSPRTASLWDTFSQAWGPSRC